MSTWYDLKDVPHGNVLIKNYFAKTTKSWRHIFVYTPPGYDTSTTTRYPVLYLQHGGGEDERVWIEMGRTNVILDNLLAERQDQAVHRGHGNQCRGRPRAGPARGRSVPGPPAAGGAPVPDRPRLPPQVRAEQPRRRVRPGQRHPRAPGSRESAVPGAARTGSSWSTT